MGRVRFKVSHPGDLGVRRRLLDKLSALGIKITRIIPAREAVIVLTATENDADAIFQDDVPDRLSAEGFTPLIPPELRAQRSVICSGLDDLVYDHTAEEIASEVTRQHTWAEAESVFKFPRSHTAKIIFKDVEMAKTAIQKGLLLFHIHVPGHQIRQEVFTSLLTCNRCNAVEEHSTKSCPKPADYVRCSECGSEEHSYRSCTATTKRCFNCGGEHSARAMRCPKRKEALKKKEEAARQSHVRPNVTFAQAAQGSLPPQSTASNIVDPSQTLTGLMCLLHAHLANASSPGCFQQTLSASLAQNGLPDVKLPPPPPLRGPEDIVRVFTGGVPQPATSACAAATVQDESTPAPDDASSVVSSSPLPSSDEEDSEDQEQDKPTGDVRFGFVARSTKRRKLPSTDNELDQALKHGSLVFCHTGPHELRQGILDYVKKNLPSLPNWITYSNEDHERARNNPQQIIGYMLCGRLSVTRK